MRKTKKLLSIFIFALLTPVLAIAQSPITLQNQRELFVDNYLLDTLHKVDNRLINPVSAGAVIKFDKPWEGNFCTYVSIVNNGEKFMMYYRGAGIASESGGQVTCYAESKDGITWTKPNLRIFEVNGTTKNNVVMLADAKQSPHNLVVIYDNRPEVPKSERYKAVGGVASSKKRSLRGLYRYVSADGLNWVPFKDASALFPNGHGMDSQNVLAWIPSENQYAIYLRTWTGDKPEDPTLLKGIRTIARSVSKDFINWSTPELMNFDTPLEDLYTNATQPYHRAPQLLIAMPFRFSSKSKVLSNEEMLKNNIHKTMSPGVSDAVLMSSRGGNTYQRKFMESFIRPGADQHNWAARSNVPAMGVIPTGNNEMSVFVTRAYGSPDIFMERMTLRVDGFASLHARYDEGFVITKPVVLNGSSFLLNYATSSIGYVQIVLLDEEGKEIPGYGLANAIKMQGDRIDEKITWLGDKTLKELAGKTVRIKFVIRDADVYSFGIF